MTWKSPTRLATLFTLCAVCAVATTLVAQQLAPPQPAQEATTKLVVQMVEREHISRAKIDDKISGMLTDKFIKDLDPQKLYFLQSDIDEFGKTRTQLDDQLKQGKLDFAYLAFQRYLNRLDERIDFADTQIDAPHDFTANESLSIDAKTTPWAKSVEELNDRWRKRIKYDLLLLRLEKTEDAEARDKLHRRYKNIKRTMHQTESDDILEMYLSALTGCFDPHSSYMSPRTVKDFEIQMRLSLDGIGAALRSEDGYTVVAQIVPGGAAAADGRLKVGDKIIGVGQEGEEIVDVVEMKLSNVVAKIRGKAGTKVILKVLPDKTTDPKTIELTRQKIELKSSEVKGEIVDVATRIKGARGRIGVVHIPSFYRDFSGAQNGQADFKSTTRDTRAVLKSFADKGGVDALVIDLRTNGGGALSEAIELSGLFIDKGPVVQVKDPRGNVKSLDDEESGVAYTGPLVVVCNRLSASASEIFAGVIKDYHRGIIVGDSTTHGKGTVQSVMNVDKQMFRLLPQAERGALKLTINQFYRVNGDSTQNKGVPSDVVLPSLIDHMDVGESFLDNAMAFDHIPAAGYEGVKMVEPGLVATLVDRSHKRVAAVTEFQQRQKDIDKYVERKQKKSVSLNEEELKKERVEEEQKELEKAENPDEAGEGPIFPDEFYNDEILAITLDYATGLRGMKTAKK